MKKIGVTGCIGSGKTMVCKVFEQLGIPVYNADERAKFLMVHNQEIIQHVILLFGKESYSENGELNRKHISSIVFNNKALLNELNKLVHPIVFADFDNWVLERKKEKYPYIIKEAALMFETDSYKGLDKFIVVTAKKETRIARTIQRDNISREQVLERMKNQFSQSKKLKLGDYEIVNDESKSVIKQVVTLHKKISKLSNKLLNKK
jgi:dephospho-CoA kinase